MDLLKRIKKEMNYNSLGDAARSVIDHWAAFDINFVKFCEDYIQKLEQKQ